MTRNDFKAIAAAFAATRPEGPAASMAAGTVEEMLRCSTEHPCSTRSGTKQMNGTSSFFKVAARRSALHLELVGLRRRGQTAYSVCKQVYGFKGSRQQVSALMDVLLDGLIKEKQGTAAPSELAFVRKAMAHAHGEGV